MNLKFFVKFEVETMRKTLADFCTSALLIALKINLPYPLKKQMVKLSKVQRCKSQLFSHGLDLVGSSCHIAVVRQLGEQLLTLIKAFLFLTLRWANPSSMF